MLELSRTVRFCPGGDFASPRDNSFSAWPAMRGLGRFYQLHVTCAGDADPVTGYFMNITHIDQAVRRHVLPLFDAHLKADPAGRGVPMGKLLRQVIDLLRDPLRQSVVAVTLELSPFYRLTTRSADMDHVLIRQQFEFAAAHRLHVPELSDEENRRVFGKCNNPAGHGHNYRLDVAVRVPIDPAGHILPVGALDHWVNRHVIERLDHKHLNVDVPQFRGGGNNPSVENIARAIYGMLTPCVGELGAGVGLEEVSVWETSKTVCTYRGASAVR